MVLFYFTIVIERYDMLNNRSYLAGFLVQFELYPELMTMAFYTVERTIPGELQSILPASSSGSELALTEA